MTNIIQDVNCTSTSDTRYGGCIMYRGALSVLLTSQTYRGMISHHGNLYPGEHERIIDFFHHLPKCHFQ